MVPSTRGSPGVSLGAESPAPWPSLLTAPCVAVRARAALYEAGHPSTLDPRIGAFAVTFSGVPAAWDFRVVRALRAWRRECGQRMAAPSRVLLVPASSLQPAGLLGPALAAESVLLWGSRRPGADPPQPAALREACACPWSLKVTLFTAAVSHAEVLLVCVGWGAGGARGPVGRPVSWRMEGSSGTAGEGAGRAGPSCHACPCRAPCLWSCVLDLLFAPAPTHRPCPVAGSVWL